MRVGILVLTGLAVLGIMLLFSMNQNQTPNKPHAEMDSINIVTFDGCEYLYNRTAYGYEVLTHKGNCTNDVHRRQ